ncbi:MAG: hypothetical protein RL563_1050 [Pseudomonadota bacterium]
MSGAEISDGISCRLLLGSDAEAAFAVHCAATSHLSNNIVRRESLEFIREQINDGFVVGGFSGEGDLVAYAVLTVSNSATHKVADLLEIDPASRKRFCLFDGVAVHPKWQFRGIHHALIAERLSYARRLGRDVIGVTVSPRNFKSLKNLLGTGFLVMQATLLYGGYERLILVQNLGSRPEGGLTRVKAVALGRFEESVEALRSGLCGFEISWNEQGQAIMHYGSRS